MRRSREFYSIVVTALLAFFTLFGAGSALADAPDMPINEVEEAVGAEDGEVYRIGTDTTFAPFEFRDPNGELVGIDIDLMTAIAEDQGFRVEFQSMGFNAALQAVQSNQVDGMIAGMGITDERKEIFDFSDPYFTGELTVAANEDSDIEDWSDLEGHSVAVKTGSLSEEWAKEMQQEYDFQINSLDQTTTMVQSVRAGHDIALVDDLPIIAYGIQQGSGLKLVSEPEPTGDYGFAVKKGMNPELVEMFNAGLANLQESGKYDEILNTYIGTGDEEEQSGPEEAVGAADGELYKIGTDTTFAPFEFRDPSGQLVGIDIDLLTAIAEDQGFRVEFNSMGFNAALQALQSNQVDGVIAGMGITDERKEIFDFSEPYFTGELTVAANEGSGIEDWSDLEGHSVAVKTGSLSEEWAKEMQQEYDFELNQLDQTTTMVESVRSGHDIALVDDLPIIAYGINQGSGLELVSEPEPTGDYGFAVNKGMNPELIEMFNAGLANLQESGEYDEILDSYLSADGENSAQSSNSFISLIQTSFAPLMKGLGNTLGITGISFAIAMILGLIFGFMKVANNMVLRGIATAFIAVFRGTPILVWAFFFYFGLPQLIGTSVNIWVAGALTLSLNGAAYIAEIVRGGIQSVDPGQNEAARSLALTNGQSMRFVVLPQAFKMMTPSLINQLVIMIKDSSLLLAIGFGELLYQAQQIYAQNFRVTEVLLIVAVIYFVTIYLLTMLANYVDKKVNK